MNDKADKCFDSKVAEGYPFLDYFSYTEGFHACYTMARKEAFKEMAAEFEMLKTQVSEPERVICDSLVRLCLAKEKRGK